MRKSIFIVFILASLSFQKGIQPKTTRLFNDNLEVLNGSIKQLIETEHNHTAEDYPSSAITITSFNNRGNVVLQRTREIWGKTWDENKYLYKYDKKGKMSETIISKGDKRIWIYKYGKDENISELQLRWNKNKSEGIETYKYDSSGNLIEKIPNQQDYFYGMTYKYDGKQHLIKEIERPDKNGRGLNYLTEYKSFDEKGNWVKKIRLKQFGPTNTWLRDTVDRKITYY